MILTGKLECLWDDNDRQTQVLGLGKALAQCCFYNLKSYTKWPGIEPMLLS